MSKLKDFILSNKVFSKCSTEEQKEINEELKRYDEMIEKATPKKPKHNEEFGLYGCPSCDFCDQIWGTFKKSNCCPNCGQTILWEDEEDE